MGLQQGRRRRERRQVFGERRAHLFERRLNLSERQHRQDRWEAYQLKHFNQPSESKQQLFLAGLRIGRSPLYQRTGGENEL